MNYIHFTFSGQRIINFVSTALTTFLFSHFLSFYLITYVGACHLFIHCTCSVHTGTRAQCTHTHIITHIGSRRAHNAQFNFTRVHVSLRPTYGPYKVGCLLCSLDSMRECVPVPTIIYLLSVL